jgi:hypothetical protein
MTTKAEKAIINSWKGKIAQNDQWALRAAIRLVQLQTAEEVASSATLDSNGVGLGAFDADIVTSIVLKYTAGIKLSRGQLDVLRRKMPKYAGQLYRLTNPRPGNSTTGCKKKGSSSVGEADTAGSVSSDEKKWLPPSFSGS